MPVLKISVGLQLDATKPSVSYIRGVAEHETARICEVCDLVAKQCFVNYIVQATELFG